MNINKIDISMRGSRKLCQRGSKFVIVFFRWRGERGSKYHYKRAIINPPAKRHLNGISLACRWWSSIECWLESSVNFRKSGPALLRNTIVLWFFRGGGGSGPPAPLRIRACAISTLTFPHIETAMSISMHTVTKPEYIYWRDMRRHQRSSLYSP